MSMRSEVDELIEAQERDKKLRKIGDRLVALSLQERAAAADVLRHLNVDVERAIELSKSYRW